jgi:hypothetical protein
MEKHPWIKGPTFSSRGQKGTAGEHPKEEMCQKRKSGGVEKPVQESRKIMGTKQGASFARRGPEGRPKYRHGATLAL